VIPIIIEEPITWDKIEVPPAIVRECVNFTKQDPYSKDNTSRLILLDCYWFKMGYYNDEGLININPIPVIPYYK
tara:strand:- start:255 stop:476 length:222 start_codon:yes stop_codon:yes gene_type:complete